MVKELYSYSQTRVVRAGSEESEMSEGEWQRATGKGGGGGEGFG